MKWFITVSVCIIIQFFESVAEDTLDVFEFGNNVGSVTFSESGVIGLTDKNVIVPIVLPKCAELTYVRVSVDNRRGPPKVDLDSEMSTVKIKYRRLQYSKSRYTILAKTVYTKKCQ